MREIKIVPYMQSWPAEFSQMARQLRGCAAQNIERIDHIGSTSVAGLAAKDVIDIQITVADLDNPAHVAAQQCAGMSGLRRHQVQTCTALPK
ncbi:MAG: GrpB family protein [bacterium]